METQDYIINLIDSSLGDYIAMGGKGSGHWAHKGRKGKRGGSAPSKGAAIAVKKVSPTSSVFRSGVVDKLSFNSGELTTIAQVARTLPQAHLDTVKSIAKGKLSGNQLGITDPEGNITMRKSEGVTLWSSNNVVHEIGHAVLRRGEKGEPNKYWMAARRMYSEREKRQWPSDLARKNFHELFSESYTQYTRAPKVLQDRAPDIYNYMRDEVFSGKEYTG